jgi:hypothetical protein
MFDTGNRQTKNLFRSQEPTLYHVRPSNSPPVLPAHAATVRGATIHGIMPIVMTVNSIMQSRFATPHVISMCPASRSSLRLTPHNLIRTHEPIPNSPRIVFRNPDRFLFSVAHRHQKL